MKVLSRLKTTSFNRDLILEHKNSLEEIVRNVFIKDAKNICPNGKLRKNILIVFNEDKNNDAFALERVDLHFAYDNEQDILLRLYRFGVDKEIILEGVPKILTSKEFSSYIDILKDYVRLLEKGYQFAEMDFEAVDRECVKFLKEQGA